MPSFKHTIYNLMLSDTTHSSILAWRIPWVEEPGRLQSMGSQRVGHDLVTKPPPPQIKQILKESKSHKVTGFPVQIKVIFIPHCSQVSVQ